MGFVAAGKADAAHGSEGNLAFLESKKSVILARAYIAAGHHFKAALTNDNSALLGCLASKKLNAKIFSV